MRKVKTFFKDNRRALLWMLASIATIFVGYGAALWVLTFETRFAVSTAALIVAALPAVIFSMYANAIHAQGRRYYFLNIFVLFVAIVISTAATADQGGNIANDPEFADPTFLVNVGALTISLILSILTAPKRDERPNNAAPSAVIPERKPKSERRTSASVIGALILGLMLGAFVRLL